MHLLDNTKVVVRPIKPGDKEALYILFSRIPKSDLLIYKDDFTRLENLENWFASNNNNKVFQLVGLIKNRIVAKGTLHAEGLFWSHAAELQEIVDPEYREKGLGSQFFNILLSAGLRNHFQKIIVRYI